MQLAHGQPSKYSTPFLFRRNAPAVTVGVFFCLWAVESHTAIVTNVTSRPYQLTHQANRRYKPNKRPTASSYRRWSTGHYNRRLFGKVLMTGSVVFFCGEQSASAS